MAMSKELALLHDIVHCEEETHEGLTFHVGELDGHRIVLHQSGMGKVNAGVGAWALISHYSPDAVVNTGVAGAASAEVSVMDTVAAERVAYHDVWCGFDTPWGEVQGQPRYFEPPEWLLAALPEHPRLKKGLTCTGDQFVDSLDVVNRIKSVHPEALAVDMESAAMAHACHMRGVPFLSLRVISDSPAAAHDNWQQYSDFWVDAPKQSLAIVKGLIDNLTKN